MTLQQNSSEAGAAGERQSLRGALEKRLGLLPVMRHENGYPVQALPKAELLDLLAAYPSDSPVDMADDELIHEIAVELNNDGAYCGNCDYEGGLSCEDCKRVCEGYARRVVLPRIKAAQGESK